MGLLVLHGIGNQERGVTLRGVLDGLRYAYGDRLTFQRPTPDHAIIGGAARTVHVFEVYWADLLEGPLVKNTFSVDRIFEATWLPFLNQRRGLLSRELYPRGHVLRWTLVLAPLSSLLFAGFRGAHFLSPFLCQALELQRLRREKRRRSAEGSGSEAPVPSSPRAVVRERTCLDDLMDGVVGDVFNYVYGVVNAFPGMTQPNEDLAREVNEIPTRFLTAFEAAGREGCREIQILAHSLGTVVAFRSMCSGSPATSSGSMWVSRFYTIGSPLEKVRFFWPWLLEGSEGGPSIVSGGAIIATGHARDGDATMTWDNFFSRLDLVSGRLRPFAGWPEPTNHRSRGLGGMIRSHGAYKRNPAFLASLGQGLIGGEAPAIRVPLLLRLGRRVMAGVENLALPVVSAVLCGLGAALLFGFGWGVGWLWARIPEWLGAEGWARGVHVSILGLALFTVAVLPIGLGYKRARDFQSRVLSMKA